MTKRYVTEVDYGGMHVMVGIMPTNLTGLIGKKAVDINDREGIMRERLHMYWRFKVDKDFSTFYSSNGEIRSLTALAEYRDPAKMNEILDDYIKHGLLLVDVPEEVLAEEVKKFFG